MITGNEIRLRMLSVVVKKQIKLRKCWVESFLLKIDIISIGKV